MTRISPVPPGGRGWAGHGADKAPRSTCWLTGAACRPLTRIVTPGQHGDCPRFIPLLEQLRIARRGKGRPGVRPGAAMGDKAYSSAADRVYLRRRGI
jgi:hypothetical protein